MPKGIYIRKDTSKMGKYQRTPEILAKYKTGLFKKNQVAYNKGKKGLQIAWNKGKHWNSKIRKKISIAHGSKKGWITPLMQAIRNSFNYRQWRSDVFQRDNYTCIWCGVRGGQLNADHIKSFSLIVEEYMIKSLEQAEQCEELWNINNGRTLCLSCHKLTNNYAGNCKGKKKFNLGTKVATNEEQKDAI